VKFLELVLQNFGPYAGTQTIDLRPEVDGVPTPIILFGGMNGGGKTTLMDAMRLALYGQRAQCSTRGTLSYADFLVQCVNRHTPPTEKTRIELLIEHIIDYESVQYRIVRTWDKTPKEGKDHLGILERGLLNEEWLNEGLVNTWDEYIETLLPIGISNLFLFDGEQVKELAELETPTSQVHEAIQSLLGLDLTKRLATDLEILVQRKRKQLASSKELANIENLEEKIEQYEQELQELEQERDRKQFQIAETDKKHQQAMEKFLSDGGKIAAERSELDRLFKVAEENVTKVRKNLSELAAGSLPLTLIQALLEQAQTQAQQECRVEQVQMARDVIQARERRLLDYLHQLQLADRELTQIQAFLDSENETLNAISETNFIVLEADESLTQQLQFILEFQLPSQQQQARDYIEQLQKFAAEAEQTEQQLAAAASPEAYDRLKKAVSRTQSELMAATMAYEDCDRQCDVLKKTIVQTKKQLVDYGEKTLARKNAQHIIESSTKVQETLKQFREKLTLRKLNKLETEVTECFRYLLHKSDLVNRVAIDTGTFRLALYDFQGQPVPKHRLSAGEKQLLAIALLWGLARVSGYDLPVAIDTPLGRLDSSHRQNLVERYFPAASHQVLLLSTDTEIGKLEYQQLQKQEAIARKYLLDYDSRNQKTTVRSGYFFDS
jgi:DNA sulfur modification protein DndD